MKVLVTEPHAGVRLTDARGNGQELSCGLPWPCMPCACAACMAVCCLESRQCLCYDRAGRRLISRMPCVPGVCDAALSPCGRFVYQLSAEADCVHTRSTAAGELLYAAPSGVFPRMMRLSAGGDRLLVAGGAVGEAYLLSAPDLKREEIISTRHPCFAAEFSMDGLVLLCAAGGEDIHTEVYTLRAGKLRPRKLTELPGEPGGLCMCPDGRHMLLSTGAGLMKMNAETGCLLWNRPEWAYAMRMECRGEWALASGAADGSAWLFSHFRPWERRLLHSGSAAQACFV